MKDQTASWQQSLGCSGVTFTSFIHAASTSTDFNFSGQYVSFGKNQLPLDNGQPVIGDSTLASTGVYLHHAQIYTDVRMTDLTAFKHTVAHEIGHTFGLRHCTNGTHCGSVMDSDTGYNSSTYGSTYPTTCDIAAAKVAGHYCYPTPTPTPTPGYCNGAADYNAFGSGCASGFDNHSGICEKSWSFQSSCNDPSGYQPDYPPDGCACPDGINTTPIVIDVDHSGFLMTNLADGVNFDIVAEGMPRHVSWTASGSTNAFLALDRNSNGIIDSGEELFGNVTPQTQSAHPNGFIALAEYDKIENGGNNDGYITNQDLVFPSLLLWQDLNHNGVSEPAELHTLSDLGLKSIDLDYKESRRTDQYGNQFRYRSKVKDARGAQLGRWAWDVFLITQP